MTDFPLPDPDEDRPDDHFLYEQFAPLRETSPPAWVQLANRAAVDPVCTPTTTWWRRSIAVPVPVLLAAAASLLVMASTTLWTSLENQDANQQQAAPETGGVAGQAENPRRDAVGSSSWSISRSYLESLETIAAPIVSSTVQAPSEKDDA